MGRHMAFWDRVTKTDTCWLVTEGQLDKAGYGRTHVNGRQEMAHRRAYLELVGPIPEGMVLDHLCRVRHCVNPDHLEPVTLGENVRRGHESRMPPLPTPEEAAAVVEALRASQSDPKRRLTTPLTEAAELMGVRPSWLKRKVQDREVPYVQTGKVSVGFTDAQIEEILSALTVQPTGTPTSLTSSRAKKRAA